MNALSQVFGADNLTTELSVFDETNKNIALQIVSGREGISLRNAECLVYYNIDFSATSYWQSKDRMTTKDRLDNDEGCMTAEEVMAILEHLYDYYFKPWEGKFENDPETDLPLWPYPTKKT